MECNGAKTRKSSLLDSMIAAAIPGHYQFSRDLGVSPVSRHFLYSFSFFGHGLETGKITKSLEYGKSLETGNIARITNAVSLFIVRSQRLS